MDIKFLYFEDCPSHDDALERLHTVMQAEGIHAKVEVIEVKTDHDANTLKFIGSPTIRINGIDIDPIPEGTPFSLSCRVYRHENGRFSPLPSEKMISHALNSAKPASV